MSKQNTAPNQGDDVAANHTPCPTEPKIVPIGFEVEACRCVGVCVINPPWSLAHVLASKVHGAALVNFRVSPPAAPRTVSRRSTPWTSEAVLVEQYADVAATGTNVSQCFARDVAPTATVEPIGCLRPAQSHQTSPNRKPIPPRHEEEAKSSRPGWDAGESVASSS